MVNILARFVYYAPATKSWESYFCPIFALYVVKSCQIGYVKFLKKGFLMQVMKQNYSFLFCPDF